MHNISHRLFERYAATHGDHVDAGAGRKIVWFREHVRNNYLPHLPRPAQAPRILEVGCGAGYMLDALAEAGYAELIGIDLSPADVQAATERLPSHEISVADATPHLTDRPEHYDVIIAKAVLEHMSKEDGLRFLEAARDALRERGRLLVEVPNMDWLFATHERYMDFTHEVGFTRESLAQLLRLVFGSAEIHRVRQPTPASRRLRLGRLLLAPLLRPLASLFFEVVGDGGHLSWWDARSILGVGVKARG